LKAPKFKLLGLGCRGYETGVYIEIRMRHFASSLMDIRSKAKLSL